MASKVFLFGVKIRHTLLDSKTKLYSDSKLKLLSIILPPARNRFISPNEVWLNDRALSLSRSFDFAILTLAVFTTLRNSMHDRIYYNPFS